VTGSGRVKRRVAPERQIEATQVAKIVFSHIGFPMSATDPVLRQIQDRHVEVVVLDLDPENSQGAIRTIELIRATAGDVAVFVVGDMHSPMHIVAAMRAGAGEYLDRPAGNEDLLEAFTRFSVARAKTRGRAGEARVFAVINAKGGAGASGSSEYRKGSPVRRWWDSRYRVARLKPRWTTMRRSFCTLLSSLTVSCPVLEQARV